MRGACYHVHPLGRRRRIPAQYWNFLSSTPLTPKRPAALTPEPSTVSRPGWVAVAAVCALAGLAACTSPPPSAVFERLTPCPAERGLTDAWCGTLGVFENRAAGTGRRIDLALVVLPAETDTPQPDPLFFLAGGPGQGAASMASTVGALFQEVRRQRDLVLVDQRGTGRSHPLTCRPESDSLQEVFLSEQAAVERLERCLSSLDADLRQYTTTIAMDDLDDVRRYLGYQSVNLYGGSYGTRAALVYLRQHGGQVRSMVLDGVAPPGMRLPLFAARDAAASLRKLLADCDKTPACARAFPGLGARIEALMQRLTKAPARVRLTHPRTGTTETVDVTARAVGNMIFAALYAPLTSAVLPLLVEHAERNDFQPLLALATASDVAEEISTGMQLSVICSEDAPRVTRADVLEETAGSVFGGYLAEDQVRACAFWPRGTVDDSYYQPVTSDVPALILSGDTDPVTPAVWGEQVARTLRRSLHVVAPFTGHGVATTPCGASMVAQFIERGNAEALDTACVRKLVRPPFFLTLAGPDSAPAEAP